MRGGGRGEGRGLSLESGDYCVTCHCDMSFLSVLFSRHRMTEREEDEELLLGEKDDIEESSNITHFSESPYCE